MTIVNSFNEWDPLQEIIVGSGVPETLPAIDFTFKLFFHDNIYGKRITNGYEAQEYITKKHIVEHNEDIEDFVCLLKSLNIEVKRPKQYGKVKKTKTLTWESTSHPSLNCRDMCMVVGDMIIESPPTCRWRYFENDYLKHLFIQYFKQGARWVTAPRPLMTDASFDIEMFKDSHPEIYKEYSNEVIDDDMSCGHEIMFDVANCMRLGQHILMNVSNENQRLGAEWLRSILPESYTVWESSICDNHIDSEFLPLRPGLAVITLPDIIDKLPTALQQWDLILVPEIHNRLTEYKNHPHPALASPKIDYNLLSISPDAVICTPECERILSPKLKKYGIEAIPSRWRHGQIFAGGHHCVTVDVRREGVLENYF